MMSNAKPMKTDSSRRLAGAVNALLALALLAAPGCKARRSERAAATEAPRPADAVVVRLSYGSEKKGFLTEAVEQFHRSSPKTRSGKPIRIKAVAEGSAESMEAILAGSTDVAVWSPASSLLVDVLNSRWAESHGGLGSEKKIAADAT